MKTRMQVDTHRGGGGWRGIETHCYFASRPYSCNFQSLGGWSWYSTLAHKFNFNNLPM